MSIIPISETVEGDIKKTNNKEIVEIEGVRK